MKYSDFDYHHLQEVVTLFYLITQIYVMLLTASEEEMNRLQTQN
jgi:hypothetical protein